MSWYVNECIKTLRRLDQIWYNLEISDYLCQDLIDTMKVDDREKFSYLLLEFEQYYQKRVEKEVERLRTIVIGWPESQRIKVGNRINQLVAGGMHRLKAIQKACYELKP